MKDILPLWNNSTLSYLRLSCRGKRFHQSRIDSMNKRHRRYTEYAAWRDFPRSRPVLKTAITLKIEGFLKKIYIALIISGADAILVFDN